MTIRHCLKMSVQEQVYFDVVIHAMVKEGRWQQDYRRDLMQEADIAGRRDATSPDVRAIYQCMDLGLSPRECYHYLMGYKPSPRAFLSRFI